MRIDYDRYTVMMNAVNGLFFEKYMTIYEKKRTKAKQGRAVTFGVNWSAVGTVEPDEAIKFAEDVKAAANIAKLLNECDVVYWYNEDEPPFDEDRLADLVVKAVKNNSKAQLIEAMEA